MDKSGVNVSVYHSYLFYNFLKLFISKSYLKMQSILITVLATVAFANAGGLQGSYQQQSVVHSHAVVAHHASPVVHAVPALHSVQAVHHAAPVVHTVHAAPALYKTVVPTAYASSYSYRAPAAKILRTVVQQPIVYAAPRPVYQTAAIIPTAYASAYNYRAPAARVVHHAPVYSHAVHHVATPVVHAAPFAVHHATPVVHAAPFAVHHASPIVHASPFAVHHAGGVLLH